MTRFAGTRRLVATSWVILLVGLGFGLTIGLAGVGDRSEAPPKTDWLEIFRHNASIGLMLLAGSLALGIVTALLHLGMWAGVGVTVGASLRLNGASATVVGLGAHAPLEISGFVLLAAAGLLPGEAVISRLGGREEPSAWRELWWWWLAVVLLLAFALLAVGSVVEAVLTPYLLEQLT